MILSQNEDYACIPCEKKYQIKVSRFDNEFLIDVDDGIPVGQVKIYLQSDTSSAFIMSLNKDVILAINVHANLPNTAIFFTHSTGAKYVYAGELKLEMNADSKLFSFKNGVESGDHQDLIRIECSASSRKFQIHKGDNRCSSFSFDNKNIVITSDGQISPVEVPVLLGIAFSASYILPFKG